MKRKLCYMKQQGGGWLALAPDGGIIALCCSRWTANIIVEASNRRGVAWGDWDDPYDREKRERHGVCATCAYRPARKGVKAS